MSLRGDAFALVFGLVVWASLQFRKFPMMMIIMMA